MEKLKPYAAPLLLLLIFETVAIVLWLAKGELFYCLLYTSDAADEL